LTAAEGKLLPSAASAMIDRNAARGIPGGRKQKSAQDELTGSWSHAMQTPLRITFRHMDSSPAVEARVHEHVDRLERFYDQITGCHVVVEAPPAHRRKGAPFDIKIDLVVPGGEIAVRSERAEHEAHMDVYVALRDAFDSARRLLQDYAREQRGDVKRHELPLLGTIDQIDNGFGRIAADDGRSVYFHGNSVHGVPFNDLSVGAIVEFEEEQGEQGPQAAAVRLWRGGKRELPMTR
jgi:ribosomal subunit interface protein